MLRLDLRCEDVGSCTPCATLPNHHDGSLFPDGAGVGDGAAAMETVTRCCLSIVGSAEFLGKGSCISI